MYTEEEEHPVYTKEEEYLLYTEEGEHPVYTKEEEHSVYREEEEHPVYTDKERHPVYTKEEEQPLNAEEKERPVFSKVKNSGQLKINRTLVKTNFLRFASSLLSVYFPLHYILVLFRFIQFIKFLKCQHAFLHLFQALRKINTEIQLF